MLLVIKSPGMASAKTSVSHPLKINPVSIPDGGGKIGLTFCPGKKHVGSYSGKWDREIGLDLEQVKAFGAKALVTLMEGHELEAVKVPVALLAERAKECGLEWHHLPIKDVNVPDERFEDLWTYSGLRLRSILVRGDNIVVHCLGGLGRTGTIGARLLVEFGDEPEVAIKRIREARPNSIETQAQEQYVKHCRPVTCARVVGAPEERVLACLLGGAIGDGFGYEVEFRDLSAIRERFGHAGIRTPVLHKGKLVVSDDTQMTLFTLEGLLASLKHGAECLDFVIPSVREAYLDWYQTQVGGKTSAVRGGWLIHQQVMRVQRAPGNTCMSALRAGGNGSMQKPANDSKGCGGAMRTAPLGLVPSIDAGTAFRLGAEAAALTHGHPSGYLSGGMVAALVRSLIDGTALTRRPGTYSDGAIDKCWGTMRTYNNHDETLQAIEKALNLAATGVKEHPEGMGGLGGGWVGEEALAIALYSVLFAESFVEAISIAANHSGDSDSTASIAGQLWGAAHGLAGMPHEWVTSLDVLVPLLHLGRELLSSCYRTAH